MFNEDDTNSEIQAVKKAMRKNKNLRMHKRYMVILRHLKGYKNNEIAEMEFLCGHTVGKYISNYEKYGLDGLTLGHSTGAPRLLNSEQEKAIVETITNNTPDQVGFADRKNWTIELIRQWVIRTFDVILSHRGMAEVLYRLNLSYTRPTYVLKNADLIKQEKFKEDFNVLKKMP
ncbi:transposase (21) [Clostridium sartagoforme AAU1]|uniref:Transposase (21) n=2 Tax=Clostridium sartagoforme TaxID=84031 RepID=R9CDX8_9CLOT|nr:transposase (21) [Clostridium sartagoforme AAU1]